MDYNNQDNSKKSPTCDPEGLARAHLLDLEIGRLIRLRRKRAKMSLQVLAGRLGTSPQQVQKYEAGVNRIAAGRLMAIANILGVPLASLCGYETQSALDRQFGTTLGDSEATLQGSRLMEAFLRIKDPARRHKVLCFARALADSEML
jgi:transcriptional regulator with XRE-family HTH domain